ncbi:MAG: hypothetical protein ABI330_04805 [Caldimonas sp.]
MKSMMVGMFDSEGQAERARAKLLEAGFSPSGVLLHAGDERTESSAMAGTSTTGQPVHDGPIMRLVEALFGGADEEQRNGYNDTYKEAFRRGICAVTIATSSDLEREKAEQVLTSSGAVDIDERSKQWRSEGRSG